MKKHIQAVAVIVTFVLIASVLFVMNGKKTPTPAKIMDTPYVKKGWSVHR